MAVGTTALVLGSVLAGGLTAAAASAKLNRPVSVSGPIALPQPPSATDAVAKADDAIRRRKASQTQSVFTNPLGVSSQADVVKKQLTGQ